MFWASAKPISTSVRWFRLVSWQRLIQGPSLKQPFTTIFTTATAPKFILVSVFWSLKSQRGSSKTLGRHIGQKSSTSSPHFINRKGCSCLLWGASMWKIWQNWISVSESGKAPQNIKLGPTINMSWDGGDGAKCYQGGCHSSSKFSQWRWDSSSKWRKVSEALKPRLARLLYYPRIKREQTTV